MKKNGLLLIVGAVVLWRAITILMSPMEWGMMDDAGWVNGFQTFPERFNFFYFLKDSLASDLEWGLFRPTYFTWSYLVYGILGVKLALDPHWAYFLCFVVYLLSAMGLAWVLTNKRDQGLLVVLLFFSFTPSLNMINLISVQERLGVLFSVLALVLLKSSQRTRTQILALLCVVLATFAKATSFIYILPCLIFLADHYRLSKMRAIYLGVMAIQVIFLRSVASQGSYTTRYSIFSLFTTEPWEKFFGAGGPWAVVVMGVLVGTLALVGRDFLKDPRPEQARQLVWPVTLAALLTVMLPWGVFGYLWSLITPAFVGTFFVGILSALRMMKWKFSKPVAAVFLVPFLISIGPKLGVFIDRSKQTREAVTWLQSSDSEQYQRVFFAHPCTEAVGSMLALTGRPHGSFLKWTGKETIEDRSTLYATWWECTSMPTDIRLELVKDLGAWKFYALPPRH